MVLILLKGYNIRMFSPLELDQNILEFLIWNNTSTLINVYIILKYYLDKIRLQTEKENLFK